MSGKVLPVLALIGGALTLAGAGWGASEILATKATKIELAQFAEKAAAETAIADAKATYALQARLERNVAELVLIKAKAEKTADDWDQIVFLRSEIGRLRKLISDE